MGGVLDLSGLPWRLGDVGTGLAVNEVCREDGVDEGGFAQAGLT